MNDGWIKYLDGWMMDGWMENLDEWMGGCITFGWMDV